MAACGPDPVFEVMPCGVVTEVAESYNSYCWEWFGYCC